MNSFPIADAHVDVLFKLYYNELQFADDEPRLSANFPSLVSAGVETQVFAAFVDPGADAGSQLHDVLCELDAFYDQIAPLANVRLVKSRADLSAARAHGQLAALLSLEGCGCLRGSVGILRMLHELGVRGAGLTWNPANELADGCGELRGSGLTRAGRAVVREMQRLSMWIDLAHLHDAGVRDILRITDGPLIASHACARAVHHHRRNLTDDVIRELIRRDGWIGITFEASFVGDGHVTVDDVFSHIDHVIEIGGDKNLGFGSDFDGASNDIVGLTNSQDYLSFAATLVARYGEPTAKRLLFDNFEAFLHRQLPA